VEPPCGCPSLLAVLADPSTDEATVLATDLLHAGRLKAVLRRPVKSAALLTVLIDATIDGAFFDTGAEDETLNALLGEPALNAAHLSSMARAVRWRLSKRPDLLGSILTHNAADINTMIDTLWSAGPGVRADMGARTGSAHPAAIESVRRRGGTSIAAWPWERAEVVETAARWATWAGADVGRQAFLVTGPFGFNDEEAMFAAGEALTAEPGRC